VISIDLVAPGPGDELVARVEAVLTELGGDAAETHAVTARLSSLSEEAEQLLRQFDAQAGSRWVDVAARRLHAAGLTSALVGRPTDARRAAHETVTSVAIAARPTDPALLPGGWQAFHLARSSHRRRTNTLSSGVGRGLLDVARALVGSAREPMSGSRYAAGGDPQLAMIPSTPSPVGHLPRAIGVAWSLGRQGRLPERRRTPLAWPDDAVAVAGFDAATSNHATVAGAVNAACWTAFQGVPLPLLLVCVDDGGTPPTRASRGWVAAQFSGRAGLEYRLDDGTDPQASLRIATDAARHARERRIPVLLHVQTGQGAEPDPLLASLRALVSAGVLDPAEARRRWLSIRDEVAACVEEALREPMLAELDVDELLAPLAPRHPAAVAHRAVTAAPPAERARVFGARLPEGEGGLTLGEAINRTLLDLGAATPGLLLLGEGAAQTGGASGLTAGLQRRLGASRVIDTVRDERTVLGMALGAGVCGLVPIVEIADLAALHAAADQLRAEAATLGFRSSGTHHNPLVIRVPSSPHGPVDAALGTLRDVPGLVVASPAHPSDAPAVLRTCLAAAEVDGAVSVVLEPAGLYDERDGVRPGDGGWLASYLPPALWEMAHVPIGRAATWGEGGDLTLVTYGHGVRQALRVAARLAREAIGVRVVDLRWLAPLPVDDVLREALATGRCLIVDETRRSGGVAEALVTALLESGYTGRLARIGADDCWVPPNPAGDLLLVSEDDVEDAARTVLG
jgi:2-oxoisovalerate dehydrogenase E1 component